METNRQPQTTFQLAEHWKNALRPWQRFIRLRSAGRGALARAYEKDPGKSGLGRDEQSRCPNCNC